MRKLLLLSGAALLLSGCASSSTDSSWSCRAVGNTTCASISQIDNDEVPHKGADHPKNDRQTVIYGAQPAAWWDKSLPTASTREDEPRRENDQTMRIVVAPYVDAQGDYHDRTIVYAVMRRANWWVVPPVDDASEPKPGTRLDRTAAASPAPAAPVAMAAAPPSPVPVVLAVQPVRPPQPTAVQANAAAPIPLASVAAAAAAAVPNPTAAAAVSSAPASMTPIANPAEADTASKPTRHRHHRRHRG